MRAIQVAMLSDRLEVVVPASGCVRDISSALKFPLQRDRALAGTLAFCLEDGQQLRGDQLLEAAVPEGAAVCCYVATIASLEARFAELGSPGCAMQKYLREYERVEASDPRVLRTFWAFAVLASTAEQVPVAFPLNEVAAAAMSFLNLIWDSWCPEDLDGEVDDEFANEAGDGGALLRGAAPADPHPPLSLCNKVTESSRQRFEYMGFEELEALITPHYSAEAHERLLAWALEELEPCGGDLLRSKRLRVALAELSQIRCRSVRDLCSPTGRISNPRLSGAWGALLTIISGREHVRCWA